MKLLYLCLLLFLLLGISNSQLQPFLPIKNQYQEYQTSPSISWRIIGDAIAVTGKIKTMVNIDGRFQLNGKDLHGQFQLEKDASIYTKKYIKIVDGKIDIDITHDLFLMTSESIISVKDTVFNIVVNYGMVEKYPDGYYINLFKSINSKVKFTGNKFLCNGQECKYQGIKLLIEKQNKTVGIHLIESKIETERKDGLYSWLYFIFSWIMYLIGIYPGLLIILLLLFSKKAEVEDQCIHRNQKKRR